MYTDLASFVAALDRAGELTRISDRADAVLEIAAAADAESKRPCAHTGSRSSRRVDPEFHGLGGRALLFEDVAGSEFPVLINAFGSYARMEMALGNRSFEQIASEIGGMVTPELPRSLGEALDKARQFFPLLKIGPKRLRGPGVCQQVVRTKGDIDLTRLPMLRCWPDDGDFHALGYPADVNAGIEGLGHPGITAAQWEAEFRGRYVTFAGVHTIHADDRGERRPRSHNIGMYRMQLMGKDRLCMHWQVHHDGAAHWRSWKRLGEPMPVAIVLGGPSVLPYAATCPLPPGVSELLMAGYLQGRGVRMCRAKTVPLWVPADAEIVIEGFVRTDAGMPGWEPGRSDEATERRSDKGNKHTHESRSEARGSDTQQPHAESGGPDSSWAYPGDVLGLGPGAVFEGPFGDHTGFYSLPDRYPLMEVTAITHRRGALFPATVVGMPVQEDYFIGKATERIMRPLLATLIPDIIDYDLPLFGAFHNCAFVQIEPSYPLHAHKVMHAVWGAGQMAWTKTIFVVDKDVDVHDATEVLAACAHNCDPMRDIVQVRGPLDILDHAAPEMGAGTKIGFDCTEKNRPGAEAPRLTGDAIARDIERAKSIEGVLDAEINDRAPGWLFVRTDRGFDEPDRAKLGRKVLKRYMRAGGGACRFVVALGRDVDIRDHHAALFHWLANCDAGRDTVLDEQHGRVGFDATPKTAGDERKGVPVREWPPVLTRVS